jgi:hypothetical protein
MRGTLPIVRPLVVGSAVAMGFGSAVAMDQDAA